MSAVKALLDVSKKWLQALSRLTVYSQLCEEQEACRDEAVELVSEFEPILTLQERIEDLMERAETRRAVERISSVVEDASLYIIEHTSESIIGMLVNCPKVRRHHLIVT